MAEAATSALHPDEFVGSSQIQSYSLEGTKKADRIMVDIALVFAASPGQSLVCDVTFRPTNPSLDKHHGKVEVAGFAPGKCPTSKARGGMELNQAVYPPK